MGEMSNNTHLITCQIDGHSLCFMFLDNTTAREGTVCQHSLNSKMPFYKHHHLNLFFKDITNNKTILF